MFEVSKMEDDKKVVLDPYTFLPSDPNHEKKIAEREHLRIIEENKKRRSQNLRIRFDDIEIEVPPNWWVKITTSGWRIRL